MSFVPGIGLVRGMALTLRRFFEPKATIRYPEVKAPIAPKNRGRLQLLYDEHGALKCETCFQCAQACPIECIDMGGTDTRSRFAVHWGPAETYAERREESALRRSGRTVPDPSSASFAPIDLRPVDEILDAHDHDPRHLIGMLEEIQEAYGFLPVAALKHLSFATGAWYAMVYGTASYYRQFRFEADAGQAGVRPSEAPEVAEGQARAGAVGRTDGHRPSEAAFLAALDASLGLGAADGPATDGTGPA
jgi:ferredoxin